MLRFASIFPVSLLAAGSLAMLPSLAPAAPVQCKGMAQAQCASADSCRWVEAYVRKDGREVNGYCRSGRGAAETTSTPVAAPRLGLAD